MDLLSSLEAVVLSGRPKDNVPKRACAILESHLPSLVQEGQLLHTLVTVLPDPTRTLTTSWAAIAAEREQAVALLHRLPGMCFAVMATEIHGGSRPKKRAAPNQPPQRSAEAEEEEHPEEDDPAQIQTESVDGAVATSAGRSLPGLKGQPHLHFLIYYVRSTIPALDLSHVKREFQTLWPRSDVNQVLQRRPAPNVSERMNIVRPMKYVHKGTDCPLRKRILQLVLTGPEIPSMNPSWIPGSRWEPGSATGTRIRALARALLTELAIDVQFAQDGATAPAVYENPPAPSKETMSMLLFAERVNRLNLRYEDSIWYRRQEGTEHTWEFAYTTAQLLHRLSAEPQILDICVRYASSLPKWFNLAPFKPYAPQNRYRFIELRDAVYDLRAGYYIEKSRFGWTCFRYYDISVFHSIVRQPTQWLKLVDFAYNDDPISANKEIFIEKMARLLRQRKPKDKILFIVGASNSGKSTVIKWITTLYPTDAIATINDSIAPLSGIKGKEILICDEFSTAKISRTNLLLLTDGTTGLTVRRMGQDAEFITNVLLPQVYTCNFGHEPNYKNDKQPEALNNRFEFFEWHRVIERPSPSIRDAIEEETPYIVFYLNRVNNKSA